MAANINTSFREQREREREIDTKGPVFIQSTILFSFLKKLPEIL